jgi:hypothetical protein
MKGSRSISYLLKMAICSLILAFSSPLMAQDFDDGWSAYESGSYEEALSILLPLAEQGDTAAQTVLGNIYRGLGTSEVKEFQDFDQAVKWYRKAAEHGNALAQVQLGLMYHDGKGVTKDYIQYFKWITIAKRNHNFDFTGVDKLSNILINSGIITYLEIEYAEKLAGEWNPSSSKAVRASYNLVEDLRSGKSKITAISAGEASRVSGYHRSNRILKTKPDHKAMAMQGRHPYGMVSVFGHPSAAAAVEAAVSSCQKDWGGTCKIYQIDSEIVQGYSQQELANIIDEIDPEISDEIEKNNLEFSEEKSETSEAKTESPAKPKRSYCKRLDGSVYAVDFSCKKGRQISKSEYERLNNGKSRSKTKASIEKTHSNTDDSGSTDAIEAKLKKLKKLLDKGLITAEEAKAKRAEILDDF